MQLVKIILSALFLILRYVCAASTENIDVDNIRSDIEKKMVSTSVQFDEEQQKLIPTATEKETLYYFNANTEKQSFIQIILSSRIFLYKIIVIYSIGILISILIPILFL